MQRSASGARRNPLPSHLTYECTIPLIQFNLTHPPLHFFPHYLHNLRHPNTLLKDLLRPLVSFFMVARRASLRLPFLFNSNLSRARQRLGLLLAWPLSSNGKQSQVRPPVNLSISLPLLRVPLQTESNSKTLPTDYRPLQNCHPEKRSLLRIPNLS